MSLLGIALRTLPLGTAYAIWTGIGSVGTALLGIVLFRKPATAMRLVCVGLIVTGIVGVEARGRWTVRHSLASPDGARSILGDPFRDR